MPEVNPKTYHQSASSNGAFQKCPTLFRLTYREGIRLAKDTDSQRQGTNWHGIHEHHANALLRCDTIQAELEAQNPDLDVKPVDAEGRHAYALQEVINLLDQRYANVPQNFDAHEWALERAILLTCFIGYQWYYTNDPIEVLASEVAFDLPLHMPKVGLPLPMDEVKRVGKMDHIIKWRDMVGVLERKSTSRSIASDSDYWDKSRKDIQVSGYAAAFRDLAKSGQLPDEVKVAMAFSQTSGNTLYDVWHKPTIKPAILSQKDTAAFISTGTYCGNQFEVVVTNQWNEVYDDNGKEKTRVCAKLTVDGEAVEVEPGAKSFAIRETIGMFSARLLADIYERPEFYFVRREIPRTDADIRAYRAKSFAIYQTQKLMEKHGCWYENEQQCRATFACPMIPICYGPGADAVCDGKTTPDGFKRIFVDLTVNGQEVEE